MTWFINIFSAYSPVFVRFVLPFSGLFIIAYAVYLIQYLMHGKD